MKGPRRAYEKIDPSERPRNPGHMSKALLRRIVSEDEIDYWMRWHSRSAFNEYLKVIVNILTCLHN